MRRRHLEHLRKQHPAQLVINKDIAKDRKQDRNDRAQRSDNHSFHHKRRPDKTVRRAHIPHDRNLVASRINCQLDRVRDEEDRQRA